MAPTRTPLLLVTGVHRSLAAAAADALLDQRPGTVVVHHDVRDLGQGVVVRTLREHGPAGVTVHRSAVELAHGCLSCTLRLDLLPLLRSLAARDDVARIVLQLDPALEPEHLCWAIDEVVLDDEPADRPETASDSVQVEAVVATLDAASWLADASGEETMADRGLAATADDERTLAQVVVGQVRAADVVLLAGRPGDAWSAAQLEAVLDRLVPGVPRLDLASWQPDRALAQLGPDARRGRPSSPHDPLLAGQPPLGEDAGVTLVRFDADRPFHPERLHEALDVLLEGVVCSRGRLWLATRPDRALWLESAGAGLQVGDAGQWLATLGDDPRAWAEVDPQRAAAAALRWDPLHGDRHSALVVLAHRQQPLAVTVALSGALLTDAEFAAGPAAWGRLADPFGDWHADPCEAASPADDDLHLTSREDGDR